MHILFLSRLSFFKEDDEDEETDDDDDDEEEGSDDEDFKDEDKLVAADGEKSAGDDEEVKKKRMAMGLCVLCIVLIALAVGLGVGLSQKDDDPAPTPTLAPAPAPTTAPLTASPTTASPTSAPTGRASAVGELFITSSADNTIYREGELQGSNFGDTDTMLVQNGPAGNTDLPDAYSLVQFTTNVTDFASAFDDLDAVTAELCLEHVVNTEADRQLQYSFCVLNDPGDVDIESLTGSDATYTMPADCEGGLIMNYPVSPSTTTFCMDVTDLVLGDEARLRGRRRNLKTQVKRNLQGEDNDEVLTFVVMIDLLQELDAPGDRFYTRQNVMNTPILAFSLGGNSTDDGDGDGGISFPPIDGNSTGPFEPCSLCVNGTEMTLPDASFSDGGELDFVCGDLEDICQAGFCNTTICDSLTLAGTAFCGCAIDL
jgi:hypothetical protein